MTVVLAITRQTRGAAKRASKDAEAGAPSAQPHLGSLLLCDLQDGAGLQERQIARILIGEDLLSLQSIGADKLVGGMIKLSAIE